MDIGSQESTEGVSEITESPELTATEDHSTGTEEQASNPFWGEVEQLTGPNVFKLIQPHLAKSDTEARARITELNKRYDPWKQFEAQGIQPEHVQQSIGIVQRMNTNPEEVYQSLHSFLEREGRLPSQGELQQEVADNEEEEALDPRDEEIQALKANQAQIAQFLESQYQAQAQAQMAAEADTWAENEWKQVVQANPDLTKEDMADIGQILAGQTNRGEAPDLGRAVAQFNSMRDRIRTTPRAAANAPRVPGSGAGGTPSAAGLDVGSMTKDQRRELVAQMIQNK